MFIIVVVVVKKVQAFLGEKDVKEVDDFGGALAVGMLVPQLLNTTGQILRALPP